MTDAATASPIQAGRLAAAPSLHERILSDIEARILSGEWAPGSRIPFEHELSAQYDCSRMTVNKALTELAKAGLIERRRKVGSFVMRAASRSAALEILDIKSEVAALGEPYRYERMARSRRRAARADQVRLQGIGAGAILDLTCRHWAGERPFCLEERVISLAAAPEAAEESFAETAPGPWLLARAPWTTAEHRIRARATDARRAALLDIDEGEACLVIERRTWIGDTAVTHVTLTYPGTGHELVARFSPTRR
jgi:GntR family histidine utilization transcriptional repressor